MSLTGIPSTGFVLPALPCTWLLLQKGGQARPVSRLGPAPFVLSLHVSYDGQACMCPAQEDPSVQITAEAMQAFRAESAQDSAQDSAPGTLPEAVLQLLPRNLYTGKRACPPPLLLQHLPRTPFYALLHSIRPCHPRHPYGLPGVRTVPMRTLHVNDNLYELQCMCLTKIESLQEAWLGRNLMWRRMRPLPCPTYMACWTHWRASGKVCLPAWMLQR